MKTNKKLVVMTLGCLTSLVLGCAAINAMPASAEVNADKFEMEYGVQMALQKDAMRWIVGMGKNVYDEIVTNDANGNVSLSVVVSSKAQFDTITAGNYMDIEKKVVIEIPDDKIYKSGDYYYANAALTGIYASEQSAKDLVAIGVMVTENGETATYEYASFNGGNIENNVRSQYEVLQMIAVDTREEAQSWVEVILGENSPYKSWFGSSEYPLVVDTAAEYDFADYDYVVDAIDTVTGKLALVTAAQAAGVPILSCMGTGNKLDPTRFQIADITKTSVCPLARIMRKECAKRGIRHLKVLYSTEEPITPDPEGMDLEEMPQGRRALPGSVAFVPSVAGLIIAGEVIRDLIAE